MDQSSSLYPSLVALSVPAVAAVIATAARLRLTSDARALRRLTLVVGLTILAQVLHFAEELIAELYIVFPTTFGYPAATRTDFVGFNLMALAGWSAALFAARRGVVAALPPLWFLGFAEVLNLVLHPALALRAGGYFPGVITAPLAGVLGVLSVRELLRVTAADPIDPSDAPRT